VKKKYDDLPARGSDGRIIEYVFMNHQCDLEIWIKAPQTWICETYWDPSALYNEPWASVSYQHNRAFPGEELTLLGHL
jgi:hypothetical protein